MASPSKRKTPAKTIMVRIVSITLAALMLLSVVTAALWQW